MAAGLEPFHPVVQSWFAERLGAPTDVQARAWPIVAAGRHLLATAPTGSGKTLAAFLWALDRLLTGAWEGGRVRVLYVSPLKALNNDVERNLLRPLAELEAAFRAAGVESAQVRVATRSGDTPQRERQRMLRHPPEILITTPESLNLLLTSDGGRGLLGGVSTVILDEIHAVAGSKRGTHLITAVDRLVGLAGEFQRVALSATIRPLARIARFVGGYEVEGAGDAATYRPRSVAILEGDGRKAREISVEAPAAEAAAGGSAAPTLTAAALGLPIDGGADASERFWEALERALERRIAANRTTLVFTNSRRMAEKVTRLLNDDGPEVAYAHHGSLAREIRQVVERRFKEGRLPAIVATSSLELGIDIGDLDEVLMIGTPPSVAGAAQRIGRAGHAVGATSRGRLYPTHGADLLQAAVVGRAVLDGDIEAVEPVTGALDVLAQVLLSMVSIATWEIEALYDTIRASDPYRELPRRHFDLVLDMLAGRFADTRIRELVPRVDLDLVTGTVRARPGSRRVLYQSGGTIPDRGYFHLRVDRSGAKIGELDEEFVWERAVNDRFVLGTQTWKILQITHNDVIVAPASGGGAMAPFWRGEELDRGFHLAERVGELLEWAEGALETSRRDVSRDAGTGPAGGETTSPPIPDDDPVLPALLERWPLSAAAGRELLARLRAQRAATGRALPHRHHLLVERVRDAGNPQARATLVLHTGWGGRVNRPYALALAAAWEERFGVSPDVVHDDHAVLVALPDEVDTDEILALVTPDRLESLLRRRLESTGFFGARFRENAGRALLLPRGDGRHRVPLWLNRQRSKKLLQAVGRHPEFPLLIETWRTCLQDEMDLDALRRVLDELAAGEIAVSEATTATPSPFVSGVAWKQTNRFMYEDDTPEGRGPGAALASDLLAELVTQAQLRPRIPASVTEALRRKLQRVEAGYAPDPGPDLVSWVGERVAIPLGEWDELLRAVARDAGLGEREMAAAVAAAEDRLVRAHLGGAPVVAAVDLLPRIAAALGREPDDLSLEGLDGVSQPPEAARERLAAAIAIHDERRSDETSDRPILPDLLAEWLRFQGPVDVDRLRATFGLHEDTARLAIEDLVEEERAIVGRLHPGEGPLEVCDRENLERLLRAMRSAARPEIAARPIAELPLFLALQQEVVGGREGLEGLERSLERLFGWPAPAAAWEEEILPARLDPYLPSWLDTLMQETPLAWIGVGRERLTFALGDDRHLFAGPLGGDAQGDESAPPEPAGSLFPPGPGKLSLAELARHAGVDTGSLTGRLWEGAWRGEVSNDAFAAVRRGILARFRPTPLEEGEERPRGVGRGRFARWSTSRAFAGHWYPLPVDPEAGRRDALDEEELNRDRARLVLRRYGVVFRELLAREAPALQWGRLFRTLRIMELSGEVLAGHFFDDVPGLQFASPAAVRRLRRDLPPDAVWWIGALDPASPCGLGLAALGPLPRRIAGNHLVFHGPRLVVVSELRGRRLDLRVAPDDPGLPAYLGFLRILLTRSFSPERSLEVETINDGAAAESPFLPVLAGLFQVTRGAGTIRLWRRY